MSKVKLAKAAGIIIFITIMSKIVGFLMDALIAGAFGATYQTDAYNMSLAVPDIIFSIVGSDIVTTFIPILSEIDKDDNKKEVFDFSNSIINLYHG